MYRNFFYNIHTRLHPVLMLPVKITLGSLHDGSSIKLARQLPQLKSIHKFEYEISNSVDNAEKKE